MHATELREWFLVEPPTAEVLDARAALSAADRTAAERAARRGTVAANPAAARYAVALAQQRLRRDEASGTTRWLQLAVAFASPFVLTGVVLLTEPAPSTIAWLGVFTIGMWWDTLRAPMRVRAARATLAANAVLADPPRAGNEPAVITGRAERAGGAIFGGLGLAAALTISRGLDRGWAGAIDDLLWGWTIAAIAMWFVLRPSEPKIFTPRA